MELHGKIIELNEGLMARDLTFFGRSPGGGQILVELWYYKRTPMFGGRLAPKYPCNYMIGFSCISTHEYNRNVSHVSMAFAGNIHVCSAVGLWWSWWLAVWTGGLPNFLRWNAPNTAGSGPVQCASLFCHYGPHTQTCLGGFQAGQQSAIGPSALLYTPKPNKWCFSDLESQQNHSKSYV